jgi:hypothetical protein
MKTFRHLHQHLFVQQRQHKRQQLQNRLHQSIWR